ncbi:MAG: hypothetical protein OHK93_008717 [Ramalina farinacea]|uniref:Uncharacterized protein n=1 Tax=Ramalina farinacea TaxID=258253 RepID=A0AA43QQ11_9LECA|nr:hypothetical protein [Ramalina farinacea]
MALRAQNPLSDRSPNSLNRVKVGRIGKTTNPSSKVNHVWIGSHIPNENIFDIIASDPDLGDSGAQTGTKPEDSLIQQMLAKRAENDTQLKQLMEIVERGEATADQHQQLSAYSAQLERWLAALDSPGVSLVAAGLPGVENPFEPAPSKVTRQEQKHVYIIKHKSERPYEDPPDPCVEILGASDDVHRANQIARDFISDLEDQQKEDEDYDETSANQSGGWLEEDGTIRITYEEPGEWSKDSTEHEVRVKKVPFSAS